MALDLPDREKRVSIVAGYGVWNSDGFKLDTSTLDNAQKAIRDLRNSTTQELHRVGVLVYNPFIYDVDDPQPSIFSKGTSSRRKKLGEFIDLIDPIRETIETNFAHDILPYMQFITTQQCEGKIDEAIRLSRHRATYSLREKRTAGLFYGMTHLRNRRDTDVLQIYLPPDVVSSFEVDQAVVLARTVFKNFSPNLHSNRVDGSYELSLSRS